MSRDASQPDDDDDDETAVRRQYELWIREWNWTDARRFDVERGVLDFLLHDGYPVDDRFRGWILAAVVDAVVDDVDRDVVHRIVRAVEDVVHHWQTERRRAAVIPAERPRAIERIGEGAPRRPRSSFYGSRVAFGAP